MNLWSRDRDDAPDPYLRDVTIRQHALADRLEESVAQRNRTRAGILFDALANDGLSPFREHLDDALRFEGKNGMTRAADAFRSEMSNMPGGDIEQGRPTAELVEEHLDRTHRNVMRDIGTGWMPGDGWDLSQIATLPRELRDRCKAAPESSPFMSICG